MSTAMHRQTAVDTRTRRPVGQCASMTPAYARPRRLASPGGHAPSPSPREGDVGSLAVASAGIGRFGPDDAAEPRERGSRRRTACPCRGVHVATAAQLGRRADAGYDAHLADPWRGVVTDERHGPRAAGGAASQPPPCADAYARPAPGGAAGRGGDEGAGV